MDFLSLIYQAMWGVKMQVFKSQKVLAVGQTSGSGGWVKKLASVTMRGDGLSIAFGNPKKTMANLTCLAREASLKLGLFFTSNITLHGVPARRKRTLVP